MINVMYSVEGVSKREYTNKHGVLVEGYKILVSFPSRFGIEHADIWVSKEQFEHEPIQYNDVLSLAIAPSGRLLAYKVMKGD